MLDLWMQYYANYEHFQLTGNQIGSRDTSKKGNIKKKKMSAQILIALVKWVP